MLHSVGLLSADVSVLPIGPIFNLPLKMEPIGNPETSVLNPRTLRNIPEDDRIQVNCSECLRPRVLSVTLIKCARSALKVRIENNVCDY